MKSKWIRRVMVAVVAILAIVVISLSYRSTAKLAAAFNFPPLLTAGLVEMTFAMLLFTRSRQRTLKLNVPQFLELGYWCSFLGVTFVNIWGLTQSNSVHWSISTTVALAISGAMWLMETTLVWLYTDADTPHVQTVQDKLKEAKQRAKDARTIQKIEWILHEAKKPDLRLIQKARKEDHRRQQVLEDGLPEFFWSQNAPLSPAQADDQKVVNLEKRMNPIGFNVDFVQNQDHRQNHLQQDGENTQENATPSPAELANPQIQLAIKTAEEMLNDGWRLSGDDTRQGKILGRGSLAKAAGVTPYCARRAIDWVRQNRQANN